MSKNKEKKIERDLLVIQMLELSGRDFKIAVVNIFKKEEGENFTRKLEYILRNGNFQPKYKRRQEL